MQSGSASIEDHLFLKSIKDECEWEGLPKRLQSTITTKEEWHRRVIDHCIKKRLAWNACFARKVCKEAEYYEEMMRYLRKNLALFPYHLSEYICRVMRASPFRYYCDMIFEVMKNEQPYDSIPNFSAADALRLTGIGRNEFIDIMNKCRSKKIMWKLNKSIAKELLPTEPVNFSIESWWGVCLVNFTLEEFKKLSEEEMSTIDKVCKEEGNAFVLFDPLIIRGLYQRGLIYFDVPVYPEDRFKVSRLEGFISNREQSYEDPIEELLYAVFVVSSENATVAELAATLQADLSQLQAAASFACRLGWAVKIIDPSSFLLESNTPRSLEIDEDDGSFAGTVSANLSADGDAASQGNDTAQNGNAVRGSNRVAFVVDANITSYLMMGSLSPGLKSHAVTLYEAGKLGSASIPDLCKDLTTLEGSKFEGDLQEFANHAKSLRCTLECLQSGGSITESAAREAPIAEMNGEKNVDATRGTSTEEVNSEKNVDAARDPSIKEVNGEKNVDAVREASTEDVSGEKTFDAAREAPIEEVNSELTVDAARAPIEEVNGEISVDAAREAPEKVNGERTVDAVREAPIEEVNGEKNVDVYASNDVSGPADSSFASDVSENFSSVNLVDLTKDGDKSEHGRAESTEAEVAELTEAEILKTKNSLKEARIFSDNSNTEGKFVKKKNFHLDVLRCESLASLPLATVDRLFSRDYDIVVSMVPLPSTSVLPGSSGLVHFGPPSYSSMTPWMKLVLYSSAGCGPLSVVLMKGQRLRFLPPPLAGCDKALLWSWDGSTIGGLGGKFEGNLVNGSILLHCLNSLLRLSAVLVQPLNKVDLDAARKPVKMDIPLPLRNSDGSIPQIGKEMGLSTEESRQLETLLEKVSEKIDLGMIGYIRLIKLCKMGGSSHQGHETRFFEWVPLSIEFGIPLFSPKLCKRICDRVVSSCLFQTESFAKHREAIKGLRKILHDICSEYHYAGPVAKRLYHKEHARESPRRQLMNYASGRWNPLLESSSPISAASPEHQRVMLLNRKYEHSEILSFDGNILRSYVLAPVAADDSFLQEMLPNSKQESPDDLDSKDVILPSVNLLFDGSQLHPFDICACLQARQPISLIAEATAISGSLMPTRKQYVGGA